MRHTDVLANKWRDVSGIKNNPAIVVDDKVDVL